MNATPHKEAPTPAPEPKKERTTAQLWSRREKIIATIVELTAEKLEIETTLKNSLG